MRGWEAPVSIELVAGLSVQDPPRGGRGPRPGDSCQPGRRGAELGRSSPTPGRAVNGIQVGSPGGFGGQYIPTAPGGEAGQEALLSHSGVERTWTLVFGAPGRRLL